MNPQDVEAGLSPFASSLAPYGSCLQWPSLNKGHEQNSLCTLIYKTWIAERKALQQEVHPLTDTGRAGFVGAGSKTNSSGGRNDDY